MAKDKPGNHQAWTASQVVAHNVTRGRELRGLTQAEVAERLTRFTGARWSLTAVAQAEGSVGGQRVRQFTANELVALARTLDLPVLFFFLPPDDGAGHLVTDDAHGGLPWEYLLVLLFGHRGNFPVLADRVANWAELLAEGIDLPALMPRRDPSRSSLRSPGPCVAVTRSCPRTCSLPRSTGWRPAACEEPRSRTMN